MENCEKVLDLLTQYIDGELDESVAMLVRAHLEECEACREIYTELLQVQKLFAIESDEAPDELLENVMAKIKAEKALTLRRRKFTKIFTTTAAAAAIALTVLASPTILMIASGGAAAKDMAAEKFFPQGTRQTIITVPTCYHPNVSLRNRLWKTENPKRIMRLWTLRTPILKIKFPMQPFHKVKNTRLSSQTKAR